MHTTSANIPERLRPKLLATLKNIGFEAEFYTNERTSSSIDDDLLKIIKGLINNKLPKEKIDGLIPKTSKL